MKTKVQYALLCVLLSGLFTSCKKDADTPSATTPTTPVIGGATSTYKDTTTVTIGNVVLKYSKTSPCYPSNEIFSFGVTATGVAANATYSWDFGDGHTNTGTNVRNVYDVTGNYTVILTIKDANKQLLNTTTVSVKAWGQQVTPHAAFSSQIYDVNYLNNMSFTSNSTVQRGTLVNYAWDWADGTTTSTINAFAPHNFPPVNTDKVYPVALVVTANSGCRDTATVPVSVAAIYSISGDFATVSNNVCTNESIVFTPTATSVPAGVVYKWDFADASGLAQGNPITHFFTYQNDYDVKMYIYLNGKLIHQTHKPVRAYGQNIRPKSLMLKNIVTYDANTVTWAFYSQSNIPHGYFTGYRWEFSDGRIDDNFNTYIEHIYTKGTASITNSVKFIVTGNSGCKDTSIAYVVIPAK